MDSSAFVFEIEAKFKKKWLAYYDDLLWYWLNNIDTNS